MCISISLFPQPLRNPNDYTRDYARLVARFGGLVEMRAAYRTQHHAILVRMMDKDSTWSYNNGLKTMIPTALVMSMTGYHYILPDMIGIIISPKFENFGDIMFLVAPPSPPSPSPPPPPPHANACTGHNFVTNTPIKIHIRHSH